MGGTYYAPEEEVVVVGHGGEVEFVGVFGVAGVPHDEVFYLGILFWST